MSSKTSFELPIQRNRFIQFPGEVVVEYSLYQFISLEFSSNFIIIAYKFHNFSPSVSLVVPTNFMNLVFIHKCTKKLYS